MTKTSEKEYRTRKVTISTNGFDDDNVLFEKAQLLLIQLKMDRSDRKTHERLDSVQIESSGFGRHLILTFSKEELRCGLPGCNFSTWELPEFDEHMAMEKEKRKVK